QYPTCSSALGNGSVGVVRGTLQATHDCVQQFGEHSVAACFGSTADPWRAQAASDCASVNPFTQLSYPQRCTDRIPGPPDSFVTSDPPCTMQVSGLDLAGADNDLLDCFGCRAEEATLQIARDVYGTNLCCIGGTCNKVLTRFACREAGGTP